MRQETANILSFLDGYAQSSPADTAMAMADDFRRRRVEKGITREQMATASGVALSNIARFEQKGFVSLKHLIALANALGYLGELRQVFATPKFTTMEELSRIRRNTGKKRAHNSTTKSGSK